MDGARGWRVSSCEMRRGESMPSLIRFLLIVGVLAGLVWGGMQALVTFVEPQQREMQHSLPASKLNK